MSIDSSKRSGTLAYELKTRNFTLTSDVPGHLGGSDLGPTPHEFLEAALAACTAITLQMYAQRKSIPLQSANVQIKIFQEGPAENQMSRAIQLVGDLTDEQKISLLAIAEKCPIHHFLQRSTKIESRLV